MRRELWYAAAAALFLSSVFAKPSHAAARLYVTGGNLCGGNGSQDVNGLISDLINGCLNGNGSSGGNSCLNGNGWSLGSGCLSGDGWSLGSGCLNGDGWSLGSGCLNGSGWIPEDGCMQSGSQQNGSQQNGSQQNGSQQGGGQDVEWFPGQGPECGSPTPQLPTIPQQGGGNQQGGSQQNGQQQGGNQQGGNQQGGGNQQSGGSQQSGSTASYVTRVVELVNEQRAAAGLSPVREDPALSAAAVIRAKETMSSFSHTRPNGSSFSTVLDQRGISYRRAGENIAYGYDTPEKVMDAWMNSTGHRANILDPDFTAIGIGYYQGSNGVKYWTQLFTY